MSRIKKLFAAAPAEDAAPAKEPAASNEPAVTAVLPPAANLDRLRTVVGKLHDEEDYLDHGLTTLAGDLAEAESPASAAGSPSEFADKILTVRAVIEKLKLELIAVRLRRRAAILEFNRLTAENMRYEAAELRQRIAERQAKISALLAQIDDLEGRKHALIPDPRQDPAGRIFQVRESNSEQETALVQSLHARAASIEQTTFDSGEVEAGSADLLVAAATGDPLKVGPPAHDIRKWAAAAESALAERRSRAYHLPDLDQIRFRLTWRGGEIVESKSAAFMVAGDSGPQAAA